MPTTTKKRKPRAPTQKQKQKQKQSVVVNINNAPKRGTTRKRAPPAAKTSHNMPQTSHTFFTSVHAPLPTPNAPLPTPNAPLPIPTHAPSSTPSHHTGTTNIFNSPTPSSPIKEIKIPHTPVQNTPLPSSFNDTKNHWSRDTNFNNTMDNYGFYNGGSNDEDGILHFNPNIDNVLHEEDPPNEIIVGDKQGEAQGEAQGEDAQENALARRLKYKSWDDLANDAVTLSIDTTKESKTPGKRKNKTRAELIKDIRDYNKRK